MANTYKIYENQTWEDISNHLYGRPDYSFELALLNGSSITSAIPAGMLINYNEWKKEELVLKVLRGIPATATAGIAGEQTRPEGISVWAINNDFIVS